MKQGNLPAKSVGTGVLELRIDCAAGYRIYFGRDGEALVILLAGGTKKRQQNDIAFAQQCWRDYKQQKRER
jgi:putative addiction module killer protein